MDVIQELTSALVAAMYDNASISRIYDSVKAILYFENSDLTVVNAMYSYFVTWGFYIMLVLGLTEMIDLFSRENSKEQIVKLFFKYGIGIALLEHGGTVLSSLMGLGNLAIEKIASLGNIDSTSFIPLAEITFDMDLWTATMMVIPGLLLYVVSRVGVAVISIQLWTRKIELLLRMAFSSLAIADIFGELTKSNGIRYLKKIFALFLQGAAIVGVFGIANAEQLVVMSGISSNIWDTSLIGGMQQTVLAMSTMFDLITLVFVVIGANSMTKQVINDALGV